MKGENFDFFEGYPVSGFVTQYVRSDVYHDATELWVYLWVDRYYQNLNKWMANDEILRLKYNYLIDCLSSADELLSKSFFKDMHN